MTPLHVLTGFLGSGKTTLLQQLLADSAYADTAVIVNEFGEVGLDHLLLEEVEEGVLLMQNGCICCTIRSDLQETLRDLQAKADLRTIPPFSRIVLETTGLADPVPVMSTLLSEPMLRHHFSVGNIVCAVDAVNGESALERQPESIKQVAVADRIVVTKCDLASPILVNRLCRKLRTINGAAEIGRRSMGGGDSICWIAGGLADRERRADEIRELLARQGSDHAEHIHETGICSFCIVEPGPLDWTVFGIWLTALLNAHGENVLRVKGILNVKGSLTPVVIHGVQHVVHPPMHLGKWPDENRDSRLVFITRGISEQRIRSSLGSFVAAAAR
ncbi:MAG: GTP-binding protein [Albidovulum sp.]|nr:GTP-binding protein [Albidovulum sp.]MDE0533856.1 GTP-binding protein [Albidovulum sp.]